MARTRPAAGAELRAYLEVLRRRRLVIVAAAAIAAAVAGGVSSLMIPFYTAEAEILLRPGDPAEVLDGDGAPARAPVDGDRYVATQLRVARSRAVAEAAATDLGQSADELRKRASASQAGPEDVMVITARDPDPGRAARVANAFARAYIENRRQAAVAGLDRASEQIDARLAELAAQLDSSAGIAPGAAAPSLGAIAAQYQLLYSRQQELLIEKSLKRGEAELISAAEAPESPSSPRPVRNAALGALAGLLAGLAYAFVREQLDDRLHSRDQAEEATQLPVLAELPRDAEAADHPNEVVAHARPASGVAEAARGLRTALTFLGGDGPVRRIAVTSPAFDEGKSFVAANLAVVCAQAGLRTVLVSADLRRPHLDSLFPEAAGGPGLAQIVAGSGAPSANGHGPLPGAGARATRIEGLSFLPAGGVPPNPAELLASRAAARVLQSLSEGADVVVVDTPPVVVTDAALVGGNVDGVLLVAVPEQTTREGLALAAEALTSSGARLLGVVLNNVRRGDDPYYGHGDDQGGAKPSHRSRGRGGGRRSSEKTEVGSR